MDFIIDDVVAFVHHSYNRNSILKGCNGSFFTVIPNVCDPKTIRYYRPISLIG